MANKGKTMFYGNTHRNESSDAISAPAFFAAFFRIITIAIITIIIS